MLTEAKAKTKLTPIAWSTNSADPASCWRLWYTLFKQQKGDFIKDGQLTFDDVAKHLTPSFVGLLGFIIYGAMFGITLFAGYGMDRLGRKTMWMWCLSGAALFTGLTYFVESYWQLAIIRALASGCATSELAISITLVNEQVPAHRRGLLYSVVQGGRPLGMFLASGVYLLLEQLGWRTAFLFGVIPLVAVMIGRMWVKDPSDSNTCKRSSERRPRAIRRASIYCCSGTQ